MDELKKYNYVFCETFQVDESKLESLSYQSIQAWDSVGHMTLMSALEEAFDIMIDVDDIINFFSYSKGKEILSKYNVNIS